MGTGTTLKLLDTVLLLADAAGSSLSDDRGVLLTRGQIGTIVEATDLDVVIVEFAGNDGKAYALASAAAKDLLHSPQRRPTIRTCRHQGAYIRRTQMK